MQAVTREDVKRFIRECDQRIVEVEIVMPEKEQEHLGNFKIFIHIVWGPELSKDARAYTAQCIMRDTIAVMMIGLRPRFYFCEVFGE